MKKLTVLLLFGILIAFKSQAQSDWKQIYNENGITISSKEETCKTKMGHIQQTYLLKIENTNAAAKSVQWDFQTYDAAGKCVNCEQNNQENHRKMRIGANSIIQADCASDSYNSIRIAMKFMDIQLAKEIKEVKVINVTSGNLK